MSEDISSTVDDAKLQTEDAIAQNTVPNTTDETNDTSKNSPAETVDKTPISSATPFKEPLKNKDDDRNSDSKFMKNNLIIFSATFLLS
jgi:hypothetical protein